MNLYLAIFVHLISLITLMNITLHMSLLPTGGVRAASGHNMRQDERIAGSRSKLDDGRSEQGPTTHRSADQSSEYKLQLLKETRARKVEQEQEEDEESYACVFCAHVCTCVMRVLRRGKGRGEGRGRGKGEERRKCRVRRLIC